MNGNSEQIVTQPEEGESLEHYLKRLPDAEFLRILKDSNLLERYSRILLHNFSRIERLEDAFEELWSTIERMDNLDYFLSLIRRVEVVRQNLLKSLDRNENELQKIYTLTNVGRLVGSSVEIAGTVGGLSTMDSHPGFANLAFRVGTMFGLVAFASSLSEMSILKITWDNLLKEIESDQEMFDPIRRWCQQTNDLEIAMNKIFPFDVTNDVVQALAGTTDKANIPVKLLAVSLKSAAEKGTASLSDVERIQSLINFCSHPATGDLYLWFIYRRHPIAIDIMKMFSQLTSGSPLKCCFFQHVPDLALAEKNLAPYAIWARIGLNLVSIFDSISSLRNPGITNGIRHLRNYLAAEMVALQRIAEFIVLRRRTPAS